MLFILLWEGFSLCMSVSVQGPVSLATANDAISAKRGRPHQSGRENLNKLFLWVRPSEWGGIWGFGIAGLHYCVLGSCLFHPGKAMMGCAADLALFSFVYSVGVQCSWWLDKLVLTLRQMLWLTARKWPRNGFNGCPRAVIRLLTLDSLCICPFGPTKDRVIQSTETARGLWAPCNAKPQLQLQQSQNSSAKFLMSTK